MQTDKKQHTGNAVFLHFIQLSLKTMNFSAAFFKGIVLLGNV